MNRFKVGELVSVDGKIRVVSALNINPLGEYIYKVRNSGEWHKEDKLFPAQLNPEVVARELREKNAAVAWKFIETLLSCNDPFKTLANVREAHRNEKSNIV